jgi:hypothetical protein
MPTVTYTHNHTMNTAVFALLLTLPLAGVCAQDAGALAEAVPDGGDVGEAEEVESGGGCLSTRGARQLGCANSTEFLRLVSLAMQEAESDCMRLVPSVEGWFFTESSAGVALAPCEEGTNPLPFPSPPHNHPPAFIRRAVQLQQGAGV